MVELYNQRRITDYNIPDLHSGPTDYLRQLIVVRSVGVPLWTVTISDSSLVAQFDHIICKLVY